MKLLRRRSDDSNDSDAVVEVDEPVGASKGRPTPKRRDSAPRRAPVVQPPRNRKEAYRWQKEQAERTRTASAPAAPQKGPAYREALRRGDAAVLPRRDQGPARKLARDYVDSRRMFSNYLLLLFPIMIIGYVVPFLNLSVIVLFLAFLVEWYVSGRRIKALAESRGIPVPNSPWSLGFYAGSRAYLPRRWRVPGPRVVLGDAI